MSEYKAYAGVGSRETPGDVLEVMTRFARHMESRGYILRSGGANGADTAFENGASDAMREIFLPWPGFNGRSSRFERPSEAAMLMGATFHPRLSTLSPQHPDWQQNRTQTLRKLMGRNVHQVLGQGLDVPVKFLICWTPDAVDGTTTLTTGKSGGTGQAIRLAAAHQVRVYNLADPAMMSLILGKISAAS